MDWRKRTPKSVRIEEGKRDLYLHRRSRGSGGGFRRNNRLPVLFLPFCYFQSLLVDIQGMQGTGTGNSASIIDQFLSDTSPFHRNYSLVLYVLISLMSPGFMYYLRNACAT